MPTRASASDQIVVRVHEVSGSSRRGWEAAAVDALACAKDEVPSPIGVEVVRNWAEVKAGKISVFHTTLRIAYRQRLKPPAPVKRTRS